MKNALTGVERALFWTLALAAFAAAAAGLAARAVDRLAAAYETSRTSYAIVRVVAPEGSAAVAAAQAALMDAPHVRSAAPIGAEQAATLLQTWSGSDINAEDMPPLQLIEVEIAPEGPNMDVAGDVIAALAQGGVTADFVQAPEAGAGGGAAQTIGRIALWGAAAFALVMALIVSFAARSVAARRRELVIVLTDLGASPSQATGRVADEAARLGLYAGLAGALLAGLTGLVLITLAAPGARLEMLPDILLPIDLAPLVAAPLGAALAAGMGARAAAGYFHRQAARLT